MKISQFLFQCSGQLFFSLVSFLFLHSEDNFINVVDICILGEDALCDWCSKKPNNQ